MSRFKRNFPRTTIVGDASGSIPVVLIQQARKSGQLNLSNRELKEVPDIVWNLHAPPSDGDSQFDSKDSEKWWDQVDLTKLILASNQLTNISDKISVFPALTVLDLHDNKLTEIPEAIENCGILDKLDVSHNELSKLPESLSRLLRLTTLLIQHNKISVLPINFEKLGSIGSLDASHNRLEKLPEDWSRITKLQRLNLSTNLLKELPATVCKLPLLSYLDLTSNNLSDLPIDWSGLKSLNELYLRSNKLSSLPDLGGCSNLKEIYCARNALTNVDVENLPPSLMIAEFRDNKIVEVKKNIVELKQLQRLDLANNDISTLPPEMGTMEHMKALNIDGNPMRGIRRDIIIKGTLAIMKYLRTRIIVPKNARDERNSQTSLPISSEVAERTKLHTLATSKSLDLSNKEFTVLSIQECEGIPLEVINLSKSKLSQLPDELLLFQSSLKTLDCSQNKLPFISGSIGIFVSLTHVNFASNLLVSLPSELSNLHNLVELNIMQNRFKELPCCVFQLSSLEHLLAGDNQIEKIEIAGLRKLTKLSTLSLQNNSISQVPPELGLISTLRNLQLEGNTFRIPRHNILQQDTTAVLEYLKGRVPNN